MAEEAAAPVAVDATKAVDEPTRPADIAEPAKAVEGKPSDGGDVPADAPAEEQAPETAVATDDQIAKDDATDAKPDAAVAESSGDAALDAEPTATNGTPASGKKANNNRRKSNGGVPEHKNKKTPKKGKKAPPQLHLDTKPGDMWMVAMRGYQPWPVIIADEDMLPESLLARRPVSAIRIDGTYREDFLEGGKNAKDRRYAVMFLGTNEFAWEQNTNLLPFDIDAVKKEVESGNATKKNKQLWQAYQVAAEGHDLNYFKELLANHEQAVQDEELAKEAKDAEKAEKAKKAAKRKSTAAVEAEDIDMEDVDDTTASAKKAKSSKKRKKEAESEDDEEQPAKTPKTTLKLTTKKKPNAEPKKSKPSKEEPEVVQPEEPPMTEEERLEKRQKTVLYLRHRLQKGFLTRNQPPKDDDMPAMAGYMAQLEDLKDLEPDIIRLTKVHKVLKGIQKLDRIPRDEEFNIKQRSNDLLLKWSKILASDNDAADEASGAATNGIKPEEKKSDEPAPAKTEDTATVSEAAKPSDADGDVTMTDATKEEAPATKADGDISADKPTEAVEAAA